MNDFEFSIISDWGSGFTAGFSVTNTGQTALDDWTVEFDALFEIINIWNAEIVERRGDRYTIRSTNWNQAIAPGETISFGFNGENPSGVSIEPTNLTLNVNADITDSQGIATLLDDDVDATLVSKSPAPSKPPQSDAASQDAAAPSTADASGVEFAVANAWNGGFTANMEVTNGGAGALNGWTLEFEAPFEITQIWNAEIVSQAGDRYVIRNASWNGAIAPGQTISFGFNGAGEPQPPQGYQLNGSAVTIPDAPPQSPNPQPLPTEPEPTEPEPTEPEPTAPEPINPPDGGSSPPMDDPSGDPGPGSEPGTGDFNYAKALQKSLLFYEAQRSGPLPDDHRIEWRGDSALEDGQDVGVDLTGGYYDAGDHVKFGFPMAASMTMLSWGVVEYLEGYEASGQLNEVLEAIKWGTDYILKAHVTDGSSTQEFWGQVGNGQTDHAYWGSAEDMTMERPAYKIDRQNPGSDLAGESAAALAAASMVFRSADPRYADRLLKNAVQLFEFADTYRGKYSDSIPDVRNFYNSWSGYQDELAWSATWLYKATGEKSYLDKAESYYQGLNPQWTQNWDDKSYGTALLLAQETDKAKYHADVQSWLDYWSDDSGAGIDYTDGGLAWLDQWGSLRYTANTAFMAGIYSDTTDEGDRYATFAEDQIDYLLGDNPRNASYMVGFGNNSPQNPHHRGSHGGTWANFNSSSPNEFTLYGALVGGPASADDFDYKDDRTDYIRNEVALDYNAGLTGALARLSEQFGGDPLTNAQLDALPGIAIANP
ncbi:MAG: glycoside hydrolase family 9 protein [Elainellaceae cyanobacterium]